MIKEKIVLSDVQIKWLKKHFKHTKNDVIRERLGLSHSTIPGRAGMAVFVTRETRRSAKMETKANKLGMIIKIVA